LEQLLLTQTIFRATGIPEEMLAEIGKLKPELLENPDPHKKKD